MNLVLNSTLFHLEFFFQKFGKRKGGFVLMCFSCPNMVTIFTIPCKVDEIDQETNFVPDLRIYDIILHLLWRKVALQFSETRRYLI